MLAILSLICSLSAVLALESPVTTVVRSTMTTTIPCPTDSASLSGQDNFTGISNLASGQYTPTHVLPCRTCDATSLWVTAKASGSASTTITTSAPVETTTAIPCLMCVETILTVLAPAPTSTSIPIPEGRAPRQRRQTSQIWGNVTMYGFEPKIDLPEYTNYCGNMSTYFPVDVGYQTKDSLQAAANLCVNRYYSNTTEAKEWRAQALTIHIQEFKDVPGSWGCDIIHSYNQSEFCSYRPGAHIAIRRTECSWQPDRVNILDRYSCLWREYGTTNYINRLYASIPAVEPFRPALAVQLSEAWRSFGHNALEFVCQFDSDCYAIGLSVPDVDASDDEINVFLMIHALGSYSTLQKSNYAAFQAAATWASAKVNGIFEDFKRSQPPADDSLPGLDLFFDIAGEVLLVVPFGAQVKKAVDIVKGGVNIIDDIIDLMAAKPSKAITPSLSQMSGTVAEIFNRWALSSRAAYENVLGTTYSTKNGSLTNLALEGHILEIPIDNATWADTLLTYETKLQRFMVTQAMQVNRVMIQQTPNDKGIDNVAGNIEYPSLKYRLYPIVWNPDQDNDRDEFQYSQWNRIDKYGISGEEIFQSSLKCQQNSGAGGMLPYINNAPWYPNYNISTRGASLAEPECFWNLPICDTVAPETYYTQSYRACNNWKINEATEFYRDSCDVGWKDSRTTYDYGSMSYWCLMVNQGTAPMIPPNSPYP